MRFELTDVDVDLSLSLYIYIYIFMCEIPTGDLWYLYISPYLSVACICICICYNLWTHRIKQNYKHFVQNTRGTNILLQSYEYTNGKRIFAVILSLFMIPNWYHYCDVIMSAIASQITVSLWLINRLIRRRSKKTWKLRVTGLCAGNSPVTGEFPAQRASNVENVSIWWRHYITVMSGILQTSRSWLDW